MIPFFQGMMDVNELHAERVRQQQQQHMSTRQAATRAGTVPPQHMTHRSRTHMRNCPALQVASAPQPATAGILPIPEHIHHQVCLCFSYSCTCIDSDLEIVPGSMIAWAKVPPMTSVRNY